ncbi:MAG: hypothetical protein CMN30_32690 [Sandaracinus sp.]|nr:hypothetical protein [Sandaracinus sp.]
MKVAVFGRGRVGRALARALAVEARSARGPIAAVEAEVVVLAVPDAAIEDAARVVLAAAAGSPVVLHCAGARGVDAYGPLPGERRDVAFGALHPLVSFAHPERPPTLGGTSFAVAGPPRARAAGRELAERCGAQPMGRGPAGIHGPAYHAAAALVANGAAALAFVGVGILRGEGLSKRAAEEALGALLISVGENVRTLGVPAALTGPVMRGDRETVRRHRAALGRGNDARRAYDALVPLIERCAAALQRKPK